ncbi:MAG: hypothetical protein IPM81_18420 [Saprospirales bacterium]|nr:hypothetical protein [Saprospirales bacterium]
MNVIERFERIPEIAVDLDQAAKRRVGEHHIEGAMEPVRERYGRIHLVYRPERLGFQVGIPHWVDFVDHRHFLRVEDGQQAISGKDGSVTRLSCRGSPINQPAGNAIGALVLYCWNTFWPTV